MSISSIKLANGTGLAVAQAAPVHQTLAEQDGRQAPMSVQQDDRRIVIRGRHYAFFFDRIRGVLDQVRIFGQEDATDPAAEHDLIPSHEVVGFDWGLPVVACDIEHQGPRQLTLRVRHQSQEWNVDSTYEVHARGYVICSWRMEARVDQAKGPNLTIAMPLSESVVFSRPHRIKNTVDNPELRQSCRGMSVDFSVDHRPVSHSVDLVLERPVHGITGRPTRRFCDTLDGYRRLGWKLTAGWPYPFPEGYTYRNRWCLSVTASDNAPNPVRGQRIYHWISKDPSWPTDSLLQEMAEYGCSIFVMHLGGLEHISGNRALDPAEMRRTISRAKSLGMRTMIYCTPYMLAINGPDHARLKDQRTECLNIWNHGSFVQASMYESDNRYDADELCLRCPEAFDYIYQTVLDCYHTYGFDGLYIDFAWPAQGLCSDPRHPHDPGLFNFHDYLRMMRMWREAIGDDALMIGHGGGFCAGSDMVEAFDGCITGEAQEELSPTLIGSHYGLVPTFWPFQRRKPFFRSPEAIEQMIAYGITPHVGLGVSGNAVVASLDPLNHQAMIALWQMWRAFPVHEAVFHGVPSPGVITLDNDEIVYSLYIVPHTRQVLLIVANRGGPRADDAPAIGVNLELNLDALGLPGKLNCWRMKGSTYETFRIQPVEPVRHGRLTVQEIDIHEFVGFVLSPGDPPDELTQLTEHLAGRPQRLGELHRQRQERLQAVDQQLDRYARLPNAHVYFSYRKFMEGRIAE